MRLLKYYFDCHIEDGEAVIIGCSASLKLGIITIPYSCIIYKKKSEPLFQKQSLFRGNMTEGKRSILWENSKLAFEGIWEGGTDTGAQELFFSKNGYIKWHCTNNGADVKINWNGKEYTGKGYAEYVDVTLSLWKLPFTELKWGRWISDTDNEAVTWIGWSGIKDENISRIWGENYTENSEIIYTDDEIRLGNRKIEIMNKKSIRDEIVSRSILGRKDIFSFLLPKKLRNIDEKKYFSEGIMDGKKGKILYEEVIWK